MIQPLTSGGPPFDRSFASGSGSAGPIPGGSSQGAPASLQGSSPDPAADHGLGRQLATLIAAQGGQRFELASVLSQVQDLLGSDTALLVPMRDLLQRPAFRGLFSGEPHPVQLGRRDALLTDLAGTYTPAVLGRLALVLDGCLGLAAGTPGPSVPAGGSGAPVQGGSHPAWLAKPATEAYPPAPAAPASSAGPPGGWGPTPAAGSSAPAWMAAPPSLPAQGSPAVPASVPVYGPGYVPPQAPGTMPARGGGNPVTAMLIVLVSLLVGGVLMGVGWIVLLNRSPSPASSTAPASESSSPASTPPAAPQTPIKGSVAPTPPTTPSAAWGGPGDYKFGRVPGGDYPNSCGFSRTDEGGRITIDKSQVEYWACRDIGGDADRGYSVVWSDGKQTTYNFRDDGSGDVVGTNGSTYPMRWRNDSHQGSDIIVISHQDGAITWIPGHVQ